MFNKKEFAKIVFEQALYLQNSKDFEELKESIVFMSEFLECFNKNVVNENDINMDKLTDELMKITKKYIGVV